MTCTTVDQTMQQLVANKDYVIMDGICGRGFPSSSAYPDQESANASWEQNREIIGEMLEKSGRVKVLPLETSIAQG